MIKCFFHYLSGYSELRLLQICKNKGAIFNKKNVVLHFRIVVKKCRCAFFVLKIKIKHFTNLKNQYRIIVFCLLKKYN